MGFGVNHVRGTQTWLNALLLSFALGGCSAILDTNKQQCKSDTDCGELNGQPLYSCVKNFCQAVTCTADAECQSRGGAICDDGSCAPPQCTTSEECSDGMACNQSRCGMPVDPVFGCFNEKPPQSSSEPAVLKMRVYQFFGNDVPVKNLVPTVCDALDTQCMTPIPVTFDYTGINLTINGLSNAQRYVIRLNGQDDDGNPLLETDYIMQRPVVGLTEEVDSVQLLPTAIPELFAGAASVTYDPKKAFMVTQVFGCDNKPLAGVSVIDSRAGTLFYLTGEGPDPNLTETDETGQVGFVNMDAAENGQPFTHKLTFKYKGQTLFSFAVQPRPGVLNFSLVYMPDWETTTDRATVPLTR
ncbi:MAG: hypothetical protein QM778_24490 [Myxococcales bacterium]